MSFYEIKKKGESGVGRNELLFSGHPPHGTSYGREKEPCIGVTTK